MPHESFSFAAPCWPSSEENRPRLDIRFSILKKPLVRAFDSRAQGFIAPMARPRSSCPPSSPNLVFIRPIVLSTARLRVLLLPTSLSARRQWTPCLSRATTSRMEPNRSSEEALNNQTAAASQPTGWFLKIASWPHLLRASPPLYTPERPSHTLSHTKSRFCGEKAHSNTTIVSTI